VTKLRRRLGLVAAVWLIFRTATIAIGPAELGAATFFGSTPDCTCAHGGGATCPMHHPAAPDRHRCTMRGAPAIDVVALTSLLSADGCVAALPAVPRDPSPVINVRLSPSNLRSRLVPPDPRPPRV